MQLQIRITNGRQLNTDQELIEKILRSQLDRFQHRLKQVQLYIEDVNGPRGGLDKHCRCVLHLRRMTPIIIRDCDESIPAMIHRVADRASHALSRQADKQVDAQISRRRSSMSGQPESN